MYAIDVPTVTASLPTPAPAGTAGFFTDGNPATATPATIVPADFLNMVMQELINVALEGTAPLSKTSYTQVRDAISNMVANASAGVGQVTNVTGVSPINSSGGATPAISISAATGSAPGSMSAADKTKLDGIAAGATTNSGTVTAVTVASANGVSASVANQGTTPQLTIALGAITPNSISTSGASSAASYSCSGNVTAAGNFYTAGTVFGSTANQAVLTANGTVYLRPVSQGSASGQVVIGQTGVTFSTPVSTPAFTCTTMNATSSDRRLKRNIKKFTPRPLHRAVPFISYTLKENGWRGLGSIAQALQKVAPEHVGEFDWHGKRRLNLNYAGAAYELAFWAGRELDRQAKLIARLEARLAKLERAK